MSQEQAAEWIDIDLLKPWGKNPRKNDPAVNKVAESIKKFGFGAPIVARKENFEIIAGHTRYKAAKILKMKQVPVRLMELSENESHLLGLADNKLGEIAEWDDSLSDLLSEFSLSDIEIAGFSEGDLNKAILDNVEEQEIKPFKKSHVLISFPPDMMGELESLIGEFIKKEEVEYEIGSN